MGTAPILMAPKKLKANSGESGKTSQHAVLDLEAEFFKGIAGSVNFLEDFLVGKRSDPDSKLPCVDHAPGRYYRPQRSWRHCKCQAGRGSWVFL